MAFTDDAVKAKLSALNDSQESIVTVAQWVMFHRYGHLLQFQRDLLIFFACNYRRHAERTAQLWLQKIRDSPPPKRLNLIYLANGTYVLPHLSSVPLADYIYRGGSAIQSTREK